MLSVRVSVCDTLVFSLISWKCTDGYSSVSADTLTSIRCTYMTESKGLGPILLELLPFEFFFLNAVKSLTDGWNLTKLAQIHHQDGGKKWLDFGDLNLIFKVTTLYKYSKSEPCVHTISWINRWNLTKLAQIHHWNWGKKWLDFGDLYLVFKVTPALWNSNFNTKKLVCTLYHVFPNILKMQWWIFINFIFCRHIDINKVYLHKKKVRARGQFSLSCCSL